MIPEHRREPSAVARRDDDAYHALGTIGDGCIDCGGLDEEVVRVVAPPSDPRERYECFSRTTQREARARHTDE